MILLDTNALLWLIAGHPRAQRLRKRAAALYISPANLLEIQFLVEVDRVRLSEGSGPEDLADDDRWLLDNPDSSRWFAAALDLTWTRDPFDRLLAAHASHRNWRLATSDERILSHLPSRQVLEL